MCKFLDTHTEFDAIAISKKHVPDPRLGEVEIAAHVDAGPVMFRLEALQKLKYQYRGQCECMAMCQDIRAAGKEIGFLTGTVALHIENTKTDLLN